MGTKQQRLEGTGEKIAGRTKQHVGRAIGDEGMRAEGEAKEMKGEGRRTLARGVDRVKGAASEALGRMKQRAGRATNNRSMQARGTAKRAKGSANRRTAG